MSLSGGTFAPVDNAAAGDFTITGGGDLLIGSGVLQLDVFGDNDNVEFHLNDGRSLSFIEDQSVDAQVACRALQEQHHLSLF